MNPDDLLYASSHEWVRRGDPATIGITHFAQDQLGDVVYVELPVVGAVLSAGEIFGNVESVKTASDLYAPVSGTVVETNTQLVESPELLNTSPYDKGWLIKVKLDNEEDLGNLLDRAAYETNVAH